MQWRHRHHERPARPESRKLAVDEQKALLAGMACEIDASPVLRAFGIRVRWLRGRFYVERPIGDEVIIWGRITPLADELLLEVERSTWSGVAAGTPQFVMQFIADDDKGTFHGLGSLDRSLRSPESNVKRTPQETLFYHFGVPIEVVARPRAWYSLHRTPSIAEFSDDGSRILVFFTSSSMWGSFGGTCLYAKRDGHWGAYRIRPNASDNLATAEAWIVKRKWKEWT